MGLLQQEDGAGDSRCDSESSDKENIMNSSTNGSGDSVQVFYYGIYIPNVTGFESRVYTDRNEALRTLKANKKARFKAFTDENAAIEFSVNGSETNLKAECPVLPSSPNVAPPENSNYKGPKSQDLVKFRKAIEKHDFTYVRKCVEENPRYLVSSGDTPQILQEGSRYNALHIAARANNANIAKYICETVRSVEFMNRLYGGAKSNLADRGSIMLDLYLNTPDKGSNETPLHFASKLGAIDVVRLLVSYEQCDRQRRNKFGDTAKDLVCMRASGLAADAGIKKDILFALEDHYYVAVLRSPDNALNPTIAEPFCPSSPPPFLAEGSTPKKSNEPPMVVSGVAGPMSASDATTFRKKWKTPPRKLVLDSASASPVVTDPEKGLERVGRALATDFNVQWKEYWAFLGEFLDLSSPEGVQKLENHLKDATLYSSNRETPEKPVVPPPEPVVSPITDLCNNFKSLVINDPRPKVSPHCLVHSSTVYATRLALSLTRGLLPSIQEIDKYQFFIEGCSKDSRFSQEDLSTAHSRLAALVYSRLCASKNDSCDFINSVLDEKTDNCSKRSLDRLKCVLNFVKEISPGKSVLKSCDCPIKTNTDSQNNNRFALPDSCVRNLNFHNFNKYSYDLDDDADDDSDNDMDEFFTPPTSPIGFEDEDEFLAASDSPEIYIEGGTRPTKVDFDVYRTLARVIPDLSPSKFPCVYFWSLCVAKHIQTEKNETTQY